MTHRADPAHRSRERGASEVFMLILMTALLGFAGLAYDAGMAFNARREATNVAASAARVGATKVSTDALYTIGLPVLENEAVGAARNAVTAAGLTPVDVHLENQFEVFVKVQATHHTTFLNVIGIGSLTVEGEARAQAEGLARG